MRFLIAGLGSVGRRHLRNLVALGERDVVLLRSHRSTLPDDELEGFPVETDLEAALGRGPQAVIVANPTALHLEVAIPAARAGCHLLIEKPVSHSMERTDVLQESVRAGGGKVLVGYQYRFHPGLEAARSWLSESAIGEPLSVMARYGDHLPGWHPWEDYRLSYAARRDMGGGVILTLSHPVDYLRWLLGEGELEWATRMDGSALGIEVEAAATVALRFAGAALGVVHLDFLRQPASHWFEIAGTEGTITWSQDDGEAHLWRASAGAWETAAPPEGFSRNDMFLREMAHFREVASGLAEPRCSLEDGLATMELLVQCLQHGA